MWMMINEEISERKEKGVRVKKKKREKREKQKPYKEIERGIKKEEIRGEWIRKRRTVGEGNWGETAGVFKEKE